MNISSKAAAGRPRVLVTGAGGLVGGRLAVLLSHRFDVLAGVHDAAAPAGLDPVALDLVDGPGLESTLAACRPDAVVHCAALADAERCQREPQRAQALNVEAARRLAGLSRSLAFRLIALSTDLVFGGERSFWREDDPARPLLTYARTKLDGEEAVLAEAPDAVVVRVCLVSGRGHGPRASATEAIAWALRENRRLRLFVDQYRTPVDVESIAPAIASLVLGAPGRLYHLGGPERLSRHELGLRVARVLGLAEDGIEAVPQADGDLAAPRPADASLDSGLAARVLGYRPRPLAEVIRDGRPRPG